MIERVNKTVYYEQEIINKVICDECGKDITNDEFFKAELKYCKVGDQSKFIESVYDTNNCYIHVCKECGIIKTSNLCDKVKEYIDDSLL